MNEEVKSRKIRVSADPEALVQYWQQAGLKTLQKQYRDEAARLYFLAGTFRQMTGEQLLRLATGESYEDVTRDPEGRFVMGKEARND